MSKIRNFKKAKVFVVFLVLTSLFSAFIFPVRSASSHGCCFPCPAVTDDLVTLVVTLVLKLGFQLPISHWLTDKFNMWLSVRRAHGVWGSVQTAVENVPSVKDVQSRPNMDAYGLYRGEAKETSGAYRRVHEECAGQLGQYADKVFSYCQKNDNSFKKFSSASIDLLPSEAVKKDMAKMAAAQAVILSERLKMEALKTQESSFVPVF